MRDSRPRVPTPPAPPGSDREVQITLASGRRVRAIIAPAVARRRDLASIARANADNHRRSLDALRRQRRSIQRLTRSQKALAEKVERLQKQTNQTVLAVVQGFAGIDQRVSQATQTSVVTTTATGLPAPRRALPLREAQRLQHLQQVRQVQTLATRAQIQNVTNVVNSVQMAAFGERGNVFAPNNLILAGNQLFWSLLEPVLQRFGALDAATASVVAALAPLGTLVTGQLALADQQHVRFISDVALFDAATDEVSISLRGRVAEGLWPEFRNRTDVPVIATVQGSVSAFLTVDAFVEQGTLRIRLPNKRALSPPEPARVAWTVDTGVASG
jgi:hypothetical protein